MEHDAQTSLYMQIYCLLITHQTLFSLFLSVETTGFTWLQVYFQDSLTARRGPVIGF
jgi:hypothetical protein